MLLLFPGAICERKYIVMHAAQVHIFKGCMELLPLQPTTKEAAMNAAPSSNLGPENTLPRDAKTGGALKSKSSA